MIKDLRGSALLYTFGMLDTSDAKTAHGLLRHSERFEIKGVIDKKFAGHDAGVIMDGKVNGIKIYESLNHFLTENQKTDFAIMAIATHGGIIPKEWLPLLSETLESGISLISGLHTYLHEILELEEASLKGRASIYDIRCPKKTKDLSFWKGVIKEVSTPIIALLGRDCAVGKRTTATFLIEEAKRQNKKAEMIFTGQTGWLQGHRYGFLFDTTLNDFVSGELEDAIYQCFKKENPDLIFLEGQSALFNPAGPAGLELIFSGNAKKVILQCAPLRTHFDGFEHLGEMAKLPFLEKELQVIKLLGADVIALTLTGEIHQQKELLQKKKELQEKFDLPVFCPLLEGVEELLAVVLRTCN